MENNDSKNIAGRYYEPDKKKSNDQFMQGLQETHEQFLDNYMEGTIDGKIEKESSKDIPLTDI